MMSRATTAVLVLSAALLAAGAALPVNAAGEKPTAGADLTGVDLAALPPSQAEVARRVIEDEFCYCGCPHTLAGCLREHKDCKHAPRMASLVVRLARQGMTAPEVLKVLTAYYAGFDAGKRARLESRRSSAHPSATPLRPPRSSSSPTSPALTARRSAPSWSASCARTAGA